MNKEKIESALKELPLHGIINEDSGVLVFQACPKKILFFGSRDEKIEMDNPIISDIILKENRIGFNFENKAGDSFSVNGKVVVLEKMPFWGEEFLRICLDSFETIFISYYSNDSYKKSDKKLFNVFPILKKEEFANKTVYHFKAKVNKLETTVEIINLNKERHYDISYSKYNTGKERIKITQQGEYRCSFYGNFVIENKFRDNGKGSLNITLWQNNNKTEIELFELTDRVLNLTPSDEEIKTKQKNNETEREDNIMNKALSSFMPKEIPEGTIAITMEGKMSVRSNDGTFVSFDKETKTLVNHMNMVFGEDKIHDFGIIMPVNKDQVKVGDIVLVNDTFGFVSEIVKDDKDKNSGLKVVDTSTNIENNIVDTKNNFINTPTIKKLVTFFDMNGDSATDNNAMGGINPMMFMMMGDKNKATNDRSDMFKMMMMSQMMGGLNTTGNSGINPMMMMLFMGK